MTLALVTVVLALCVVGYLWYDSKHKNLKLREELEYAERKYFDTISERTLLKLESEKNAKLYLSEVEKNKEIVSQKKSSETRLGQVTEHIVPFIENCRHDPKNMHFLGQPVDYIVFDFDQGEITFVEVKTGNAKESARQKTIKNIIKSGKVFYETMRINAKGVTVKTQENEA